MKVNVIIERGEDGSYDACMEYKKDISFGLLGQGKTVNEAIADFYVCYDEMKGYYKDESKSFPENIEFVFKYDMASFLQYYSDKFTLAGLQAITGINQGQLSHYVTGRRNPSEKTVKKIETSIHTFAKELSQISFI